MNFSDPFGLCPICLVAWGVYEVGSGIFDAFNAIRTASNPDASFGRKASTIGLAAAGLLLPGGGYSALDDLADAGKVIGKGGELTRAGRALEKHGSRPGSAFPRATGNIAAKNATGQEFLEDILTTPGTRMVPGSGRNRGGFDIFAPDGRGARYNAKGDFVTFLEPARR